MRTEKKNLNVHIDIAEKTSSKLLFNEGNYSAGLLAFKDEEEKQTEELLEIVPGKIQWDQEQKNVWDK